MGKQKCLTDREKGQIDILRKEGLSNRKIAQKINRSPNVVDHYVNQGEEYGKNYKGRTVTALTLKEKRKILRVASNSALSTSKIKELANVEASKSTVRRAILSAPHLQRKKLQKKPPINAIRKQNRLNFAKDHMNWGSTTNNDPGDWKFVVFTDEKKFNIDGPDGYNYYFHDLRKEERFLTRHHSREGGVMVWGAITYYGTLELEVVSGKMTGNSYKMMLENKFPKIREIFGPLPWIFQQDNAPVHTAGVVRNWISMQNVETLSWPPYSPDLNIIENVWGWLTRKVYENGRQFETKTELIRSIRAAWSEISLNYLESLYNSMPNRIFDVILQKGGYTKY